MDDGRTITKGNKPNTRVWTVRNPAAFHPPQDSRPPPGGSIRLEGTKFKSTYVEDRETSMEGCQTPNTTPRQHPAFDHLGTPVRASLVV